MTETKLQESAVAENAAGTSSAEPRAGERPDDEKPPSSGVDRKPEGASAKAADGTSDQGEPGKAEKAEKAEKKEPPLLARRGTASGTCAAAGWRSSVVLAPLTIAGHDSQWRWGGPVGALFLVVTAWGIMDLLGTFDDPDDRVAASSRLSARRTPIVRVVVTMLAFLGAVAGGQGGGRSQWLWGIAVAAAIPPLGSCAVFDPRRPDSARSRRTSSG